MLMKTKQVLRVAAEAAGLTPTLADATAAAEQRRQALTDAQRAADEATAALESAHDAGAPAATIQKAEAALADARMTADRAQLAWAAAERRLNLARDAEASKIKAAAAESRDAALAAIHKAAMELDKLAALMATAAAAVDAQYAALNEARRSNVVGPYTAVTGGTLVDLAMRHAMAAQAGAYVGDKPTAADAVQRVAGAVRAVA